MNILKKGKRKLIAGILSAIMMLSILPITGLSSMAAETSEVQQRLEFAAEKGLSEWVDTEGYLKEEFYQDKLSHYDLEQIGVQSLINNFGEIERTARINQLQNGIMTRTVTGFRDMVTDGVNVVGYFEVDGRVAVCVEHSVVTPGLGSPTGTPVESFNQELRKVLYYGSHGPGAILSTSDKDWVITSLAASRANGDTAGTNAGIDFLNKIASMPEAPPNFHVWIVDTNGGATQDLAYWTLDEKGYVNLNKVSSNPEITNDNSYYSLAGAVYGVYTEWGCYSEVGRLTTDEWGNTNTLELNAGTYYVKELIAPQGYALDEVTVHEVTVTASQTATVYTSDFPQSDPVSILLQKVDAETGLAVPQGDTSLANAEFTIKYFSGLYGTNPEEQGIQPTRTWILKTDNDGFSYLSDEWKVSGDKFYYNSQGSVTLPIGTITIQETKAPEGYLLNSEIFVMQITSEGTNQFVNTYNAPIIPEQVMRGSVELYKSDDESSNALAGAVYGIYFHDGTEVGKLTTDETGYAKSNLLPYGSYYLQEITAPNGYVLDTAQYPFTIGTDGQVITINATDKNQMGQIQGTKTGEVLTGSDFRLTELGMMYSPIYEVQGLPNAVYEIYAGEDIATPEGTVKYTAGQLVETVTTDENGQFTSQQLYLGTYVIKEKTAPEGYVQDTTEYEVTLSYGGQNENIVLASISLSNERQKVIVSLKKEMEENTVYPNEEAYKDIQFGLYAAEDILDVNGTAALEKDSLLEVITLDKEPAASETTGSETLTGTVSMDLPIGNYYLQEIATNEAYILDTTKYPVEFTYQGQETATVEIVANNGQAIVNELQKGQVELIKESDFPTGALEQGFVNHPLEGAVYGIYSTDGKEVGRLTTDITGHAKSELLPYGSYYLKEISAPFGYEINETEYHFVISTDGEVITITAKDQPKIGTITPEYTEHGGGENLRAATTGYNQWFIPVLTSSLLVSAVLLAGIILHKKAHGENGHS